MWRAFDFLCDIRLDEVADSKAEPMLISELNLTKCLAFVFDAAFDDDAKFLMLFDIAIE